MNKKNLTLIIFTSVLFFVSCSQNIFAADISFKLFPNNDTSDKSTIVEVRIDPKSKNLNVVEGIIKFEGLDSDNIIINTETGGSVLNLWTSSPQYYPNEQVVRFTGGSPDGFDTESLLLRLRIASLESGNIKISWVGGTAYLNDGKGTSENIFSKSININLDKQNPESINNNSADTTPPSFAYVNIGKDESTYDGKYFVSFYADDDISGVSRYEVQEGNIVTEVVNGIYIFKDQSRKKSITITAYDQAGNSEVIKISGKVYWLKYVTIIFVIIFVSVLFTIRYAKKRKFK